MIENEQEPEREVEEMQELSDRLGAQIGDARDDWEAKKADAAVPGAAGDPPAAHSDGQPETAYPAKGDSGEDEDEGGGIDAGEALDARDPENEDL